MVRTDDEILREANFRSVDGAGERRVNDKDIEQVYTGSMMKTVLCWALLVISGRGAAHREGLFTRIDIATVP